MPLTAGFTIIETLLVLAVTGALVSGILLTVGASLNTQRYRDSADNTKALLQAQYDELASVQNDRENNWSCNAAARLDDETSQIRGQSDCVLLGKLISMNGGAVTVSTIVGVARTLPAASNDIDSLRNNYTLGVSELGVTQRTLEWGTEIAWPTRVADVPRPGATTPRQLSLLFVKSPDSGQLYTFSADTVWAAPTAENLRSMIVSTETVPNKIICIDPQGLAPPEKMAVTIPGIASTPSAVELQSNTLLGERGSQC